MRGLFNSAVDPLPSTLVDIAIIRKICAFNNPGIQTNEMIVSDLW